MPTTLLVVHAVGCFPMTFGANCTYDVGKWEKAHHVKDEVEKVDPTAVCAPKTNAIMLTANFVASPIHFNQTAHHF